MELAPQSAKPLTIRDSARKPSGGGVRNPAAVLGLDRPSSRRAFSRGRHFRERLRGPWSHGTPKRVPGRNGHERPSAAIVANRFAPSGGLNASQLGAASWPAAMAVGLTNHVWSFHELMGA